MSGQPIQVVSYFAILQARWSTDRLAPYCLSSDADYLDAASRYLWNLSLCEALYPSLQALEISLRNALHDGLTSLHGMRWFDKPGLLDTYGSREVNQVEMRLSAGGKQPTPSDIIAGMTFGFWTSLFNVSYERPIWQPLLRDKSVFAHAGSHRTRKDLSARMNSIRYVRNRVFHHEPVWRRRQIVQEHAQILEAIGWIDPVLAHTIAIVDRFPTVHQAGSGPFRAILETFCQQHGYQP